MFKLDRFFSSKPLKLFFEHAEEVAVNSSRFSCNGKVNPLIKIRTKLLVSENFKIGLRFETVKFFHLSTIKTQEKEIDEVDKFDEEKSLLYNVEFGRWEKKNKKTFLKTVNTYKTHVKNRAGHVEFIKAALKHMKEHGVHKDLECYKEILDVLPKGVYVSKNIWLAASMYFPRQQYAVMDLLQQMGNNGVCPDIELGIMIRNIFGKHSVVNQKFEHMLYWTVKWRHKSPFKLPQILPSDPFLLAKIAIERITSVDPQTEITELETSTVKDSIDKTWIVSGQSPKQRKLLQKHSRQVPVVVEGANLVWLRDKSISYFVLKADGEPLPFVYPEDTSDISNLKSKFFNPNFTVKEKVEPSVHEQDDGVIYAVCATGTSTKDSLLSWIRILENMGNSVLSDLPILFRFYEKEKLPATTSEAVVQKSN